MSKWTSVEDREFLFPGHRSVGTFLTAHPIVVFLALSVGCSAVLFLPAFGLHLLSIPVNIHPVPQPICNGWDSPSKPFYPRDVGILHKWNWSLSYSVIIPLIFALAAAACRSVKLSLTQLVRDGTVQLDKGNPNGAPSDFVEKISRSVLRWDQAVFWGSIILSVATSLAAANLASPKSNPRVYARVFASKNPTLPQWSCPCTWDDIDWMHGWTISTMSTHRSWPYIIGNFVFYLVAEAVQGFVIFLASYFVLKFLTLTQSFAAVIIEDGSGFHFEPFISDPERCLGLRPIGRFFSIFLLLSIVFQIFAFGLRLQSLLSHPDQPHSLFHYVYSVADAIKDLTISGDEAKSTDAMNRLVHAVGFHDLNAGLISTLVLMIVPMAVIAWWPIVRMRNYVSGVRQKQLQEFRIQEREARQTQRYEAAKHISDDMEKLAKSSIWPNGFKIGWGSFFFLFALLVSTIVPPLIVPLVGGGVGLKILKKITSD